MSRFRHFLNINLIQRGWYGMEHPKLGSLHLVRTSWGSRPPTLPWMAVQDLGAAERLHQGGNPKKEIIVQAHRTLGELRRALERSLFQP